MGGGICPGHEVRNGTPAFLISQHYRKPKLEEPSNLINLAKNCSLKFDKNPPVGERRNGGVGNCFRVSRRFGRFDPNVPCQINSLLIHYPYWLNGWGFDVGR